ncbi:hypothetical protein LP420_33205 [Massilia sp. B-10]|nr:hypothetical protein LP420_33205 [Massilia sp. B-10]
MANALPSNAAPMLDLLAEVARTPSFPAGEVELTKGNALQGLKASEAQPGFRVDARSTRSFTVTTRMRRPRRRSNRSPPSTMPTSRPSTQSASVRTARCW